MMVDRIETFYPEEGNTDYGASRLPLQLNTI